VKVAVPVDEVVNHTYRYGYIFQNVLAICNFDMRFNFIVAGWPSVAHDTRILSHALVNFSSFPVPPKGTLVVLVLFIFPHLLVEKYYLVASVYANRISYLAPYKGSAYHMLEFRHRTGPPTENTRYSIFCIRPFEM
jgi:hypothetical protein